MFEVFTETGTRTREFISITETKSFGLSRAFLDKYAITKDHKAVILYDKQNQQVALYFTMSDPKFGFALRIANPKHGAAIVAKSFFELKEIDTMRYAGRYDDFEQRPLKELGFPDKEGIAYVFTLKERPVSRGKNEAVVPPGFEDDEPINLDDIPF